MNHREPPHLPAGASRALRYLSLLLLPALAPEAAPAMPHRRNALGQNAGEHGGEAVPYLALVGAPPLRFQKNTPPPDLVSPPAAGAPPVPTLTPTESAVALANLSATRAASASIRDLDEAPVTELEPVAKAAATPARAKPTPRAILADDTRPQVRPEDFLPYFQVPGAGKPSGEVNVIMSSSALATPGPAPLPPSTATYSQTPK